MNKRKRAVATPVNKNESTQTSAVGPACFYWHTNIQKVYQNGVIAVGAYRLGS